MKRKIVMLLIMALLLTAVIVSAGPPPDKLCGRYTKRLARYEAKAEKYCGEENFKETFCNKYSALVDETIGLKEIYCEGGLPPLPW